MVVIQQLRYMQYTALGYDKDHVVTLPYYNQLNNQYESFRNSLLQNAGIKDVGRSSRIPTGRLLDNMGASAPGADSMVPVKAEIRYVAAD
jgi:putative ABC transport system permease protein